MKNYLLVLLASTLLLGACQKDTGTPRNTSMTLTGDWYMTKYVAFAPTLPSLTRGDILWRFNANAPTITIQNNTSSLQPSGTYTYTNTATEITINFTTYTQTFDYSFSNGEMILSDNPQLDGPVMTFVR